MANPVRHKPVTHTGRNFGARMKAVAYYRVSTAAQGRSGLGLDAQKAAVADLARQRDLVLLGEFTEVESGKRNDRPTLAHAVQHARITNAVLVIAKLDRLSRNAAFLLTLRDSGVRFLAADVPDANDLTIGVLAVIAQAEREAISRRTKEALALLKAKLDAGEDHTSSRSGRTIRRLGNPQGASALGDYARSTDRATRARQAKAAQREVDLRPTLIALAGEGIESLSGIAKALNDRGIATPRNSRWHPSTVRRLLQRR